ncbi:MAG TPA: MopE-related protein, partial [Phnomibacter sp.]|nr:MopE-related protein [Phnomibacter sp.]
VTQATTGNQPLFVANGLNGSPVLRFSTSQWMSNPVHFQPPYSVVYAARQTGPARRRVLSSQNNNWLLGWWSGKKSQAYFEGWINNPNTAADAEAYIYSATGDGTSSSVYENGTLLATNSNGTDGPSGIRLNGSGSFGEHSDADFTDVFVFNMVLSDEDRRATETSIGSYYNIANQFYPGVSYLWSTGETIRSITASATGNYSVTVTDENGCEGTASKEVMEITPSGDPSVFGDNKWIVYAWNVGDHDNFNGASWDLNYSGYYTAEGVNFNTQNDWDHNGSPADAAGYIGCPLGADSHSWSAKRQGFPCNYYTINIDGHDDQGELWINGVMVWQHIGCCDSHTNVWQGLLGPADKVEFRATEGPGLSYGAISFVGIQLSGTTYICNGATNGTLAAPLLDGATYLWSPGGETTPTISDKPAGDHTVTITVPGCGSITVSESIELYASISGNTTICEGSNTILQANSTAGSKAWNSGSFTFTKTDVGQVDEITEFTHITRGYGGFIYNSVDQTGSSGCCCNYTLSNVEWALGNIADWATLTYSDQVPIPDCYTPNIQNLPLVMHLKSEDIYLQVVFSYWQAGGGGNFTYTRTTAPSYLWSTGETTSSISVTTGGTYSVSFSSNCTSMASVEVTVTPLTTWYTDADGDGYGSGTGQALCDHLGTGWSLQGGDCDDNNNNIYPGASEICGNGIDDNCQGQIDEGCIVCPMAQNLEVINIKFNSATLQWTANGTAQQWEIRYRPTIPASPWTTLLVSGASRSVALRSLLANTTYSLQVRAQCNSSWMPYSPQASFSTPAQGGKKSAENMLITQSEAMMQVFPNPAKDRFRVVLQLDEPINAEANIVVSDMSGKDILSLKATMVNGLLQQEVRPEGRMAGGIYLVRVVVLGWPFHQKLMLRP